MNFERCSSKTIYSLFLLSPAHLFPQYEHAVLNETFSANSFKQYEHVAQG